MNVIIGSLISFAFGCEMTNMLRLLRAQKTANQRKNSVVCAHQAVSKSALFLHMQ
jgi:hypothetical protein